MHHQNLLALAGGVDARPDHDLTTLMRRDNPYALGKDEIIVDSFAGVGGMSTAIEQALGRSPDVAINHWDAAISTHQANHPDTRHFHASVYAVDPRDMVPSGKTVGLLWASPDCFVAGTLVLTDKGFKPIEDILVGDNVLTHKGRWRKVKKTWKQTSQTVEVRGYGHYGLITTPGHGFYSKHITTRYPSVDKETGKRPGPKRTIVENPYWPEAANMEGKLWATPRTFPAGSIPICSGIEFSEDFFYFLGRWLGDGSINKGDVEICAGLAEAELVEKIFTNKPLRNAKGEEIKFRKVDRVTTIAFIWGCAPLVRWLEKETSRLCENKKLPIWCLSMQESWRKPLLDGYVDADGYNSKLRTSVSSVSKQLAIGARLLATSLGHSASMYHEKGGPCEIQGRAMVARDRYSVEWTRDPQRETTFTDQTHQFTPVREVTDAGQRQVFCLQVDEDESFIADGIVVHNCRDYSRAKNGSPKSKSVRMLADAVIHYAKLIRPRMIGIENVVEFENAGELDDDGRVIESRKGEIFKGWVCELERLGYVVEWRPLNAADYGAPTLRLRLFLQARRDGLPIIWPEATHGAPSSPAVLAGHRLPWRTAAECIEFDRPVHSIFLDREQGRIAGCKRPLVDKTMRRIARGLYRHVVNAVDPFIVTYYGEKREDEAFRGMGLGRPFPTATAGGNRFGLVVPLTHGGDNRVYGMGEPLRTITGANRGETAYVAATMVQIGYGERKGQLPRIQDIRRPIGTLVASSCKHAVVEACLNEERTHGAISAVDRSSEVAEFLWNHRHLSERPVTRDALGVVHVDGRPMRMTDVGLRMLAHTELSTAQGFDNARFDPRLRADGKRNTGGDIIKMIGNSVSPPVGKAVVEALFGIGRHPLSMAA